MYNTNPRGLLKILLPVKIPYSGVIVGYGLIGYASLSCFADSLKVSGCRQQISWCTTTARLDEIFFGWTWCFQPDSFPNTGGGMSDRTGEYLHSRTRQSLANLRLSGIPNLSLRRQEQPRHSPAQESSFTLSMVWLRQLQHRVLKWGPKQHCSLARISMHCNVILQ
jgi:hypothetical protein